MRFGLVFLACFAPLCTILFLAAEREPPSPLPKVPDAPGPSLLGPYDFQDRHGVSAFAGHVRDLSGLTADIVKDGRLEFHLAVHELARAAGGPRFERFTCLAFGEDGKLRLRIESPFVDGDLRPLLQREDDAPRVARLTGGVVVRDPEGRVLLEAPEMAVDFGANTLHTDHVVQGAWPERGIEFRARGLDVDGTFETVRLGADVVVTALLRGDRVTLAADGEAELAYRKRTDEVHVTVPGRARFEHPAWRAEAGRIEATVRDREVVGATLDGDVAVDFVAPWHGVERARADLVGVEGALVRLHGVGAVARLEDERLADLLGPGVRTFDVTSPLLVVHLEERAPRHVEFPEGIAVHERDGPARFTAAAGVFDAKRERLFARKRAVLRTAELEVDAEHLRLARSGNTTVLDLEGAKRIAHAFVGPKGPLAIVGRSRATFTSKGPVRVVRGPDFTLVRADDEVELEAEGAALACGRLVVLHGAHPMALADGGVRGELDGGSFAGERLLVDRGGAMLSGAPARLAKGGRRLAAPDVTVRFDPDTKELASFAARGGVDAADGARTFAGAALAYDAVAQTAVLTGAPARLADEGVEVTGPGFDLALDGEKVATATARGKTLAVVRRGDRVWRLRLAGRPRWDGDRLLAPQGGEVLGLDAEDAPLLRGKAADLEVRLDGGKPVEVLGRGGVELARVGDKPVRVVAETLTYDVPAWLVHLRGDARVTGGALDGLRFAHVVFVYSEKDGVTLKRASGVERDAPE